MKNQSSPKTKASVKKARRVIVAKKKPATPRGIDRNGRPKKKKKPEEPHIIQRRNDALELRSSGATYQMIADQLGYYDASHARRDVEKAIENIQIDAAKNVVAMDIAMFDEFKMRCLHALRQNGDLTQIDRIFRIVEWKYRLLGISDETVRALQSEHGLTSVTNNTNNVMVVQAAPETEHEFIAKMMKSVGVDPNSKEAQELLAIHNIDGDARALPMLEGSANAAAEYSDDQKLEHSDIVDAEIVE